MDSLQWLLVALGLIGIWTASVYYLQWKGILAKANMSPFGPFIMWKTAKGREFLDRLSRPKRFWRVYGDVSIALCVAAMVGLMAMLIWTATLVSSVPRESAPTPDLLLGLPGINRVIPLGYGILGLAIAIVLHEFLHGILARTAKVELKSLGILLCIFPVGAFVEPNEDEMKKMKRRDRARLFAAGPATNIVLAIVFAVLFSTVMMGSVRPVHEGVGITGFSMQDSPAERAGMLPGMIIFAANGTHVTSLLELSDAMDRTVANQTIDVETYYRGNVATYHVTLINESGTHEPKRAIMGVRLMALTTAYFHPFGGSDFFGGSYMSIINYITLPFKGLQPLQEPVTEFYVIDGIFGSLPTSAFWIIANCFYWLFWLNLMLGATNALPAVPLDGGYIFKDGIDGFLEKVGVAAGKREKMVGTISLMMALFVLALIIFEFVGPWVL